MKAFLPPLLPHLAFVSALISPAIRAELIPAARLVDWTPGVATGVPGGMS